MLPERQCWFFRQQIELMYSRCDLDGDGRLDYEEFKRLILRQRYPDRDRQTYRQTDRQR